MNILYDELKIEIFKQKLKKQDIYSWHENAYDNIDSSFCSVRQIMHQIFLWSYSIISDLWK